MKYTIKYQYGTYSGTEIVFAEDEEQALSKMWKRLRPFMTLGMAYQHAEITSKEDE